MGASGVKGVEGSLHTTMAQRGVYVRLFRRFVSLFYQGFTKGRILKVI